MSRRWRGGQRPAGVVVDEVTAFMPGPVLPAPKHDVELAELREKVSKLRAQLTEEIVRADDADRALDGRDATIREKDRTIARLERELVRARSGVPDARWDGVEREPRAGTEASHWYRIAHELQERNRQLQAANEARDRAPAGWRR